MKLINRFLSALFLIIILAGFSLTNLNAHPGNENAKKLILGEKSLNFIVISDEGRDGTKESNKDKKAVGQVVIAKQMGITAEDINASFVVTCGDNFHGKGVTSSADPFWAVNFENVYTAKSLMIPWYITLGNHDYEGNVDGEIEYAKTNKRWTQPARYYTVTKILPDSTSVLLLILDSSPFVQAYLNETNDGHHVKGQNFSTQVKWCDSVLSTSNAKWKFAFFHHPAYSASSKHGSTKEIQENLVPLFEKYYVDACFSGHDHDMQHSHPEKTTVEYFGVGAASETRPVGNADYTKFGSSSSLGFGVVSITKSTMKFSFVSDSGEQIYNYEIHK